MPTTTTTNSESSADRSFCDSMADNMSSVMTVVAPGNFDDRGLEAAYRRSLATPFRIACLVPTLTAVSLAFGPPVNCNVFVPSRLGMLLEDAIRYFGAAIAVASMFCTQARLFDDHLDAFAA